MMVCQSYTETNMKIMLFLTTTNLIKIHGSGLQQCLEVIAENCFDRGIISVFQDNSIVNFSTPVGFSSNYGKLMKMLKWSFLFYNSTTRVKTMQEIIKQPDHEAVFLLYNNAATHNHFLKVLKSFRVLGPSTKIIVIPEANSENVSSIFQETWKTLRYRQLYMIVEEKSQTLAHNFQPFSNTIKSHELCLPGKCPLTRNATKLPIIAEFAPHGEPYIEEDSHNGICYKVINTITTSMNLTLKTISNKNMNLEPLYSFNSDGSLRHDGFLKRLHNHEIDIICGAYSISAQGLSIFDPLPVFIEDDMIWTVPKPKRIEGLKTLLMVFEMTVWICTIAAAILTTATFTLYQKLHQRNRGFVKVFFDIYGLTLGNALTKSQDYFRQLLWLFLLYGIIITASFKTKLMVNLTVPQYEKQFATPEEAIESGMIPIIHISLSSALKANEMFHDDTKFPGWEWDYQCGNTTEEMLATVVYGKKSIALVTELQADIEINRKFLNSDGSTNVDTLIGNRINMHMHMSPGHLLYHEFNRKTLYLNEAGLVNFWARQIMEKVTIKGLSQITWNGGKNVPISLSNLRGLFYLFAMCIGICCLVCTVEIIINLKIW